MTDSLMAAVERWHNEHPEWTSCRHGDVEPCGVCSSIYKLLAAERRRVYEEMVQWEEINYFGDDDYGTAVGRVMRELQRICGAEYGDDE